ncbi:membrane protein [Clostridia bacterium]|nr:membrane protein [Clostridia bacterium]
MNTGNKNVALTVKEIVICAIFIALSFVLANVKVMGSVAFDSLPAFLGGLLLGAPYGAAIGALGHLMTALLSGFPFGLLTHLIVAGMMAVCVFVFTLVFRKLSGKSLILAYVLAAIVGTAINGPVEVFVLSPILLSMFGGVPGLISFAILLTITAACNIVIAIVLHILLEKRLGGKGYLR